MGSLLFLKGPCKKKRKIVRLRFFLGSFSILGSSARGLLTALRSIGPAWLSTGPARVFSGWHLLNFDLVHFRCWLGGNTQVRLTWIRCREGRLVFLFSISIFIGQASVLTRHADQGW